MEQIEQEQVNQLVNMDICCSMAEARRIVVSNKAEYVVKKNVSNMKDDTLLAELQDWFRIGRNQDGLKGLERKYFQEIVAEIKKRKLLDI